MIISHTFIQGSLSTRGALGKFGGNSLETMVGVDATLFVFGRCQLIIFFIWHC